MQTPVEEFLDEVERLANGENEKPWWHEPLHRVIDPLDAVVDSIIGKANSSTELFDQDA